MQEKSPFHGFAQRSHLQQQIDSLERSIHEKNALLKKHKAFLASSPTPDQAKKCRQFQTELRLLRKRKQLLQIQKQILEIQEEIQIKEGWLADYIAHDHVEEQEQVERDLHLLNEQLVLLTRRRKGSEKG